MSLIINDTNISKLFPAGIKKPYKIKSISRESIEEWIIDIELNREDFLRIGANVGIPVRYILDSTEENRIIFCTIEKAILGTNTITMRLISQIL